MDSKPLVKSIILEFAHTFCTKKQRNYSKGSHSYFYRLGGSVITRKCLADILIRVRINILLVHASGSPLLCTEGFA